MFMTLIELIQKEEKEIYSGIGSVVLTPNLRNSTMFFFSTLPFVSEQMKLIVLQALVT